MIYNQCWDLKISNAFCWKFTHVVNTEKYKLFEFKWKQSIETFSRPISLPGYVILRYKNWISPTASNMRFWFPRTFD